MRLDVVLGILGAALIIGCLAMIYGGGGRQDKIYTPGDETAAISGPAITGDEVIGGSFVLINQNGKTVTEKDYHGKYVLLTFGFTYCPDICPTKLQDMSLAVDALEDDAKWVQILFISIDPQRDKPAQMKGYVGLYPNNIQGLTGTKEQIADIAKKFKVYYKRAEDTGDGNYMMDHSAQIYLLDPEGKFLEVFTSEADSNRITSVIKSHLHPQ